MSKPHRGSDRVDHEEKNGRGNNVEDYSDGGGDVYREVENEGERYTEVIEEMTGSLRRASSFSSLSRRGLEKEIIRDSGFAYDHEIHGHISNAATRKISNSDQASSIGRSPSPSTSDRRNSTSSSLQSFETSIDKVEQGFSSGSCAEDLTIEETSHNSYSLITGLSSFDKSLRSESANSVGEKQLETSSVAQTTLMSPAFSISSNSRRLIRSFSSFETPQFPELGAETPTDISVQVLPDDNENRAGTGDAEIHARDELSGASRSYGRGVPVSIVHRHSAHGETVCAVPAEEGEMFESAGKKDNRVKCSTYVEKLRRGEDPRLENNFRHFDTPEISVRRMIVFGSHAVNSDSDRSFSEDLGSMTIPSIPRAFLCLKYPANSA
ncbi:uncharacterized protein H6S33_007685 [Morchella sextelata]|uniref:uncharacterized protein n=1 Tax=Morchella sextelata TaxID=1174677 RepID=UPI001D05551E|nr:uncharacterized protein H6S33_007685 [Morchella sextelata]KAH0603363.1 hypothetical protein H6S33_007685 [Morchella sextelata]